MATAEVRDEEPALWLHRGAPPRMRIAHRHDDIELNFVARGRLEYLFGGRSTTVEAGQLAVFWGATPHRLVADVRADTKSDVCWLHLPLAGVLGWGMPAGLVGRLMLDQPVVVDGSAFGDVSGAFDRWAVDLAAPDSAEIALLEAQALVRRALRAPTARLATAPRTNGLSQSVAAMATYIALQFRDPIRVTDVADVAHLHPSSAMSAFRSALGVTIAQYLTRCRVAEAQRLLITTDRSVGDVGAAAGFSSQSAFYEAFTRATGRAPAAYRRALRAR